MSVVNEVKVAYADSWMPWEKALKVRKLRFRASKPISASSTPKVFAIIGKYNRFSPKTVASAIIRIDPTAAVWVSREGSVALYIRTSKVKPMMAALKRAKADEVNYDGREIRAWWD